MEITQDAVVGIHYTLKSFAGDVIDSSSGGEPLVYLHGQGQLVPGLERELTGKKVGDKFHVKVAAADGYGDYDQKLLHKVPRSELHNIPNLAVGMQLQAGHRSLVVTEVGDEHATLDGNHPLAGQQLNFDIEVVEVRVANEEELSHGHVHGPGGHHH